MSKNRRSGNLKEGVADPVKAEKQDEIIAEQLIGSLQKEYLKVADKAKAEQAKKYMRGQFHYFGISTPLRREIDKRVTTGAKISKLSLLLILLPRLWKRKEREFQLFGVDLCKHHKKLLASSNNNELQESVDVIKDMIETKSWWDTVDLVASQAIGYMVRTRADYMVPVMDEWIEDENKWVRRAAILHQLNFNKDTVQDRLFDYCLRRCHEREFFIEKSIGWALRNYHRYNPDAVEDFVEQNRTKMAKLSVREALKHSAK